MRYLGLWPLICVTSAAIYRLFQTSTDSNMELKAILLASQLLTLTTVLYLQRHTHGIVLIVITSLISVGYGWSMSANLLLILFHVGQYFSLEKEIQVVRNGLCNIADVLLVNYGLSSIMFGSLYLTTLILSSYGIHVFPIPLEPVSFLGTVVIMKESLFRFFGLFALCGLIAGIGILPSMATFGILRLLADYTFAIVS